MILDFLVKVISKMPICLEKIEILSLSLEYADILCQFFSMLWNSIWFLQTKVLTSRLFLETE